MTEVFELDTAYESQCEAHDVCPVRYPRVGVELVRCRGYAIRGVTWEGRTEGTHRLLVCGEHLLRYAAPVVWEVEEVGDVYEVEVI